MTFAVRHNLTDGSADNVHFGSGEPIPARKVTGCAGGANIALDVRQSVVNAIKTTWAFCSPAVDARLCYVSENLSGRKVAGVNFLVCRPQKDSPPFVSFCVSLLSRNHLGALIRRVVLPAIRAVVAPALSVAVASSALIGQPKRAGRITQENLRIRGQELFATIAIAETIFWRDKSFSHKGLLA